MSRRLYVLWALLLVITACQPTPAANSQPTVIPFPTMTPGRTVRGALPTPGALPVNGSGLANPATAIALANRPTATPDSSACPPAGTPALGDAPTTGRGIVDGITRFLSDGGTAPALESGLRDHWRLLGDEGFVRNDVDLTGEGVPEVLVGYVVEGNNSTLLIEGCVNGRYSALYQAIADSKAPPQIIWAGNLNSNPPNDLLFTTQQCSSPKDCAYQTQLATWDGTLGRFISLLNGAISSEKPPTVQDIDNDRVTEVVVHLDNPGNADTGPLRTGVKIYDWNGTAYVLSIIQLDPPRFRIQVVQEADKALGRLDGKAALPLYQLALDDQNLRPWTNDEPTVLHSYILYRLLLTQAFLEDKNLLSTYQRIANEFPDPAARPIYAALADTFWNGLQATNNLHSACQQVQAIIQTQPEAVNSLNRYGSRSPTYTAQDVCPF